MLINKQGPPQNLMKIHKPVFCLGLRTPPLGWLVVWGGLIGLATSVLGMSA
jgi:hypothetical protein